MIDFSLSEAMIGGFLAIIAVGFLYMFRDQIGNFLSNKNLKKIFPTLLPLASEFHDLVKAVRDAAKDGNISEEEYITVQKELLELIDKLVDINIKLGEE